jgi:hypothetical protein
MGGKMRTKHYVVQRMVAVSLLLVWLGVFDVAIAVAQQLPAASEQQSPAGAQSNSETPAAREAREGGAAIQHQSLAAGIEPLPDSPSAVRAQSSPEPPTQSTSKLAPSDTQKPVGTAAAEVGAASGVAASKPAGVAIAPARQRRVRSFLIKMGAIAGAGVAIGTVVALSQSSPSKPPGAH